MKAPKSKIAEIQNLLNPHLSASFKSKPWWKGAGVNPIFIWLIPPCAIINRMAAVFQY